MEHQEIRQRSVLMNVLIALGAVALVFVLLMVIQTNYAADRQDHDSRAKLQNIEQRIQHNQAEADENWQVLQNAMTNKLNTAAILINRKGYQNLGEIAKNAELEYLAVYSADWKLVAGTRCRDEAVLEQLKNREHNVVQQTGDVCVAWNSVMLQNGSHLVGGKFCTEYVNKQQILRSIPNSVKEVQLNDQECVLIQDRLTEEIIYAPESFYDENGELQMNLGWKSKQFMELNGTRYAFTVHQGKDYTFVSLMPQKELSKSVRFMAIVLTSIFAIIIFLVSVYAYFVRRDIEKKRKYRDRDRDYHETGTIRSIFGFEYAAELVLKVRNMLMLAWVSVFLISLYLLMITALGSQHYTSEKMLQGIDSVLKENDARMTVLAEQYAEDYTARANELAFVIKEDPTLLNRADITRLAQSQGVDTLYIFNERGVTVATNDVYQDFVLSSNPEDQSYAFWPILKGYKDIVVQTPQIDESVDSRVMQYIGVRRQDALGMVQVGMNPKLLQQRLAHTQLDEVLSEVSVENGGFVYAVDMKTGTLLKWKDLKSIGREAGSVGLTESALQDDYAGWQRFDDGVYYVNTLQHKDILLCSAVPRQNIYAHVGAIAAVMTINCAVALSLLFLLLIRYNENMRRLNRLQEAEAKTERNAANPEREFFVTNRRNQGQLTQSVATRWDGGAEYFANLTAEQKLRRVLSLLGMLITFVLFINYKLSENNMGNALLNYILSCRWERAINIFALSYVFILLLEIYTVSFALRALIRWVARGMSTRDETIARLIVNFIKYMTAIGIVLYSIQFFGVNSTTILTGTGLVTLGISLGSQSLVADILAGVFIVFEGEFRVGDIVTIGDFRGTVDEIGIRTTKIRDDDSDVKIFRNSQISGVVNMTNEDSLAYCLVQVSYDTSLDELEKIVEKEFPLIRQRIPELIDDIIYYGVEELQDSGILIRIGAPCEENVRKIVRRKLNKEIKNMLDRYHIEISYPQMVLHHAEGTENIE